MDSPTGSRNPQHAAHLLIAAGEGRHFSELREGLAGEVERFRADGFAARACAGLVHVRESAVSHGERTELIDRLLNNGLLSNTVSVSAFDAVLEVTSPQPISPSALAGLADRLGSLIDPSRSTVHVGIDHRLMDGGGAIELFFGLRSVPDASRGEFHEWWLHQLVAHTMHTPGKTGYRQVHADAVAGAALADAAGLPFEDLDGVAVEIYPDLTEFFRAIRPRQPA